jgi:hypothetical protein
MSTKATVAYGNNFHFYRECFDEDFMYLELEGVQFEAGYNRVMVPIPVHIWEIIRKYEGVDLSWASQTDPEILRYVEQEVDKRIDRYQQTGEEKGKRLIALLGSIPFGSADIDRSEQIESGVSYFKNLREHQQQIKQAIQELEQINKSSE